MNLSVMLQFQAIVWIVQKHVPSWTYLSRSRALPRVLCLWCTDIYVINRPRHNKHCVYVQKASICYTWICGQRGYVANSHQHHIVVFVYMHVHVHVLYYFFDVHQQSFLSLTQSTHSINFSAALLCTAFLPLVGLP